MLERHLEEEAGDMMIIDGAMGVGMMIAEDTIVDHTIEETGGIDMTDDMMIGVEEEIDMTMTGIADATTRQRDELELLNGMQRLDNNNNQWSCVHDHHNIVNIPVSKAILPIVFRTSSGDGFLEPAKSLNLRFPESCVSA
jgi:hypothetical protein